MTLAKNSNHVEEALANRIEQFKDKVRFGDLLTSYVEEVQSIEDALLEIQNETELPDAAGQQLDNIGEIVGEERFGRSDLQYRTALSARIQLNLSEGTREDIINLMLAVSGGVPVQITEFFPAAFIAALLDPIDPNVVDIDRIASFVRSGKPAGVNFVVTFGVVGSFQYDGPAGTGYDEGKYGGAQQ